MHVSKTRDKTKEGFLPTVRTNLFPEQTALFYCVVDKIATMIMMFVNNRVTINGLLLVFACVAYANVYSVISEDEGKSFKVVRGVQDVNGPFVYARGDFTGDIQETG